MSSIVESERVGGEGPMSLLFGRADGATRIWMIHMTPPEHFHIGLHRHGGDEIWRVRRGTVRVTVGDEQIECRAGEIVVVPPEVAHGVMVLSADAEVEVIGELEMGEWVTVIDADGSRREVEAHVPFMPWHRPPPEGTEPTGLEELLGMMDSTAHLL